MFNVPEIILKFEILSAAEIILFQFQTWLRVKYNTEIISELFRNNFISHITMVQRRLTTGFMTNVTCRLTAKKLGLAPCPMLVIEYGTNLLNLITVILLMENILMHEVVSCS